MTLKSAFNNKSGKSPDRVARFANAMKKKVKEQLEKQLEQTKRHQVLGSLDDYKTSIRKQLGQPKNRQTWFNQLVTGAGRSASMELSQCSPGKLSLNKAISCRLVRNDACGHLHSKNEKPISAKELKDLIIETENRLWKNEHPEVESDKSKLDLSSFSSENPSSSDDYEKPAAKPAETKKVLKIANKKISKFLSKIKPVEQPEIGQEQQHMLIKARAHHEEWKSTAERLANLAHKTPTDTLMFKSEFEHRRKIELDRVI